MENSENRKKGLSAFPGQFWLVIIFEFFERGSYYGMMSILSVYLTEHLHFAKESVGIIKGTIQPLLGMGYFLTAQATSYALVFGALVVMGFGAGTFKPIISGTIARVTDEENSTLGFGIFYWSINLGAFLFPLILVPILKKMDWSYVIIASAIGTAAMIIPTLFFYKDPVKKETNKDVKQTNLIQTLANAFEIIYSPVVLLFNLMKATVGKRIVILGILIALFVYSLLSYLESPVATEKYPKIGIPRENTTLIFQVDRNMLAPESFALKVLEEDSSWKSLLRP
jgi:dipeptide/tripeptide permease